MPKDNLPDTVPAQTSDLEVFSPPESFEVIDRGSAQSVRFDHLGDSFTGMYEGTEDVTTEDGEVLTMATFTGTDAKPYCIFPGASLRRALRKVEPHQWCRITLDKEIDVGRPSPLKSYVVEVGR